MLFWYFWVITVWEVASGHNLQCRGVLLLEIFLRPRGARLCRVKLGVPGFRALRFGAPRARPRFGAAERGEAEVLGEARV